MPPTYKDKFYVLRAGELMPSVFGDPTIIVASIPLGGTQRGESYTLYRHNNDDRMQGTAVTIDVGQVPPTIIPPWTLENTAEEARNQALIQYREHIETVYPQATELKLFQTPFNFETAENGHLARLWMRHRFHEQITTIKAKTQCHSLRAFLEEIGHFPVITINR